MKRSPQDIAVPRLLRGRPKWHGLPIPYVALVQPGGTPDFRVMDERRRLHVIQTRRCQLCGELLTKNIFFVGGPKAAKARLYFEPATHLSCLIYAMQVCPFICGKLEHADLGEVRADNPQAAICSDETYSNEKSENWVILKATGYVLALTPQGTALLQPQPVVYETEPLKAATMNATDWARVCKNLMLP